MDLCLDYITYDPKDWTVLQKFFCTLPLAIRLKVTSSWEALRKTLESLPRNSENLSKMRLSELPKQLNYESIEIPAELNQFVEEDLPHLIGEINQDEPVVGCIEWVWAAWRSCINILHRITFICCWIYTSSNPSWCQGRQVVSHSSNQLQCFVLVTTSLSSSWASACLPSSSLSLTPSTRSAAAYEPALQLVMKMPRPLDCSPTTFDFILN